MSEALWTSAPSGLYEARLVDVEPEEKRARKTKRKYWRLRARVKLLKGPLAWNGRAWACPGNEARGRLVGLWRELEKQEDGRLSLSPNCFFSRALLDQGGGTVAEQIERLKQRLRYVVVKKPQGRPARVVALWAKGGKPRPEWVAEVLGEEPAGEVAHGPGEEPEAMGAEAEEARAAAEVVAKPNGNGARGGGLNGAATSTTNGNGAGARGGRGRSILAELKLRRANGTLTREALRELLDVANAELRRGEIDPATFRTIAAEVARAGEALETEKAQGVLDVKDLVAEGVKQEHAEDWLLVRREKARAPLTRAAWEKIKAEAQKAGLSVAEVVEQCAANCWATFEAAWLEDEPEWAWDRGRRPTSGLAKKDRDYGKGGLV
jgi:hypothetical protein